MIQGVTVESGPDVLVEARRLIRDRLYLASEKVDCSLQQGQLLLTGKLNTYYQKQMAQEAVAAIEGVDAVVNQIEVL